ncbi:MAG: thiamine-phosphate pyrophosphorylase [Candidatus Omnitrophota bacterium]
MPRNSKSKGIDRIIDANLNRIKEGLRVLEEISRFVLVNRYLTSELKKFRHRLDSIIKILPQRGVLLKDRNSLKDIGKTIYMNELRRNDCRDIFSANIQRVKESLRVLEEFSKLKDTRAAIRFKEARYYIYELEKKIDQRLSSLRYLR